MTPDQTIILRYMSASRIGALYHAGTWFFRQQIREDPELAKEILEAQPMLRYA